MSGGRFKRLGSVYHRDPIVSDREHRDAEQAETEAQARVTAWVAAKLVGQNFGNLEALENAACEVAVEHLKHAPSDVQYQRVRRACVGLWMGVIQQRELSIRYALTEKGELAIRKAVA